MTDNNDTSFTRAEWAAYWLNEWQGTGNTAYRDAYADMSRCIAITHPSNNTEYRCPHKAISDGRCGKHELEDKG